MLSSSRNRLVAGLGLATVLGALLVAFHGDRGPAFKGHSLRYWVIRLDPSPGDVAENSDAQDAIRSMGEKALPYLIAMAKSPDESPVYRHYRRWYLPRSESVHRFLPEPRFPVDQLRCKAVHGIGLLGPEAAPAVPFLVRLLFTQLRTERRANGITHVAIGSLGLIGPEARSALPLLRQVIEGRQGNSLHRCYAVDALGRIDPQGTEVVSLLGRALEDTSPEVRQRAAFVLGLLGRKAESAEHDLVTYVGLPQRDENGRVTAMWALQQIRGEQTESVEQ